MKHKIILAVIGFSSLLPVNHSSPSSISFKEIKPYGHLNFLLIFFFSLQKFLMKGELWCSISHHNIGICVTNEVPVSIILRKNRRACFALTKKKKKSTLRQTFSNELHFVSKKHFTLSAWL